MPEKTHEERLSAVRDEIQKAIDQHVMALYNLYDVSKALPHPYDAFRGNVNKALHDFKGLAGSINSYIAVIAHDNQDAQNRIDATQKAFTQTGDADYALSFLTEEES